jgi:hypothetical protein
VIGVVSARARLRVNLRARRSKENDDSCWRHTLPYRLSSRSGVGRNDPCLCRHSARSRLDHRDARCSFRRRFNLGHRSRHSVHFFPSLISARGSSSARELGGFLNGLVLWARPSAAAPLSPNAESNCLQAIAYHYDCTRCDQYNPDDQPGRLDPCPKIDLAKILVFYENTVGSAGL